MTVFLTWIVNLFLSFFAKKAVSAIESEVAQKKSDAQIDQHAADTAKEEQDAKSKAELDKADADILGHL